MKNNYLFIFVLFFTINSLSFSGINGLTHHSRANCINNETISWDATNSWYMFVISHHINYLTNDVIHTLGDHESNRFMRTKRAAQLHWGEGIEGGWAVLGEHWILDDGIYKLAQQEYVIDCDIYNGWWDWQDANTPPE